MDWRRTTSVLSVQSNWTHGPAMPHNPPGKLIGVVRGKKGRPAIDLLMGTLKFKVLVDTGASCSLLRLDCLERIAHQTHRNYYLSPTTPICGVSGK